MVYMFETNNSTTNLSMGLELRSLNILISCAFSLLLFIHAYKRSIIYSISPDK